MINGKKVYAFVFARGGSKGLPGKNIRQLGGKPMIGYSIESALKNKYIDEVFVSTDDEKIAEVAKKHGAKVPFKRPSELASDSSPEWLSWRHAANFFEKEANLFDIFISLPATSPLRSDEDVCNCIEKYENGSTDVVLTVSEAERSPWFNMVKMKRDGSLVRVIEPSGNISRRQDAPKVFDVTTVAYVTSPVFIQSKNSIFDGRVQHVLIPRERAIDIDTELDFKFAEFLLKEASK